MTRDATKLISMPVMDIGEGRQIGRVKDAIFDPDAHALYGLLVTADVGGESFLSRQAIKGLGEDAVTIDGESAISPIASEMRARELMDSGIKLRGCKVVNENGDSLGTLDRIMLDDEGCVQYYESSSGMLGLGTKYELKPEQVLKIGADAIVVSGAVSKERPPEEAQEPQANGSQPSEPDMTVVQGVPAGTDPTKETLVAVPDSQPGNLIDDRG